MEKFLIPCLFKALSGIECPGCGLQRSILFLLQGKFAESIELYWATVPILGMFLFTLLQLIYKFKRGSQILIFLYSCTAFIIICQYIYKLTNHN
jgi:hypothetical protein